MNQYNLGFIIEQALGHITHTKNLRANVPHDQEIQAHWVLPEWQKSGLKSKIPVYKSNWTVQAGLQARQGLRQLNGQVRLDALFFHTQVTATLAQNWIKQIPSVVSLDATPLQYDALGEFYTHESGPSWLENFKWRLNRDCFKHARHLVTWSDWAKEGLVADYEVPPEKVTVIPPGVNPDEWKAAKRQATSTVKILFVGGNLERKGGLVLLDAFRALKSETSEGNEVDVELHLVTKDQADPQPGLFVYNNMQPNSAPLKKLYHDCDIFCLPTYGDCLPMVLSEAGAAGLPVVSTTVAAIPEIVHENKTGFLVKTGDAQGLKEALKSLVTNQSRRLEFGQRAEVTVKERYDAQANARRLLTLLKQIAAGESS
ncbi:MAG: glycosyltransferase family 4 protein [Ardenticatenaceae bacterium]|nr:glycosyltransferase family 4 protein [Ardenticatenaceae bacterium]